MRYSAYPCHRFPKHTTAVAFISWRNGLEEVNVVMRNQARSHYIYCWLTHELWYCTVVQDDWHPQDFVTSCMVCSTICKKEGLVSNIHAFQHVWLNSVHRFSAWSSLQRRIERWKMERDWYSIGAETQYAGRNRVGSSSLTNGMFAEDAQWVAKVRRKSYTGEVQKRPEVSLYI